MSTLETFTKLAAMHSTNQADRLAFHVGLLEEHIKAQDRLLDTFTQELDQIILELSQEKA